MSSPTSPPRKPMGYCEGTIDLTPEEQLELERLVEDGLRRQAADLEHRLARVKPRLLGLAADLAANGDRTQAVPADLVAGALDTLGSICAVLAAERRGERALR